MNLNNRLCQAVSNGNLSLATKLISKYGSTYPIPCAMGYALLRDSTKNNDTEITKLLLINGVQVNNNNNKRKIMNDTPLHFAVQNGQLEIVEMLLDKGANINAKNEYGATALQKSVLKNRLDVVELLLSRGASVDDKNNDGLTCLHTAVQKGSLGVVEILLKYKANVNAVNSSNFQTPLHYAVEKGNERIVELLLKNGANVDAKAQGLAPIYFATLLYKNVIVKLLLEHGAKVDTQDTFGKTILYSAVEIGDLKMVELILKHGPDLNNKMNNSSLNLAINGAEENYKLIVDKLLQYGLNYIPDQKLLHSAIEKGYTHIVENCLKNSKIITNKTSFHFLHTAVQKKEFDITKMLLDHGVNVNCIDGNDKTAIYYATCNGDIRTYKLLLEKGASVTKCSGLLINAVKRENQEMLKFLLEKKVNVNETDDFGRTALHYCCINQLNDCLDSVLCMELIEKITKVGKTEITNVKREIAKILIAAGADVNAKSHDGRTALHNACFNGYHSLVELLFEHNANVIADDTGELPLHLSAYSGNVDILKMLITKGADVNAKRKDGWTAVHIATVEVKIVFLEYILNHGAKIDEKEDVNGLTALHIAAEHDYLDFVELLLNYGADIECTDSHGKTAFSIATNAGHNRIVKVLLEYGCDSKHQIKKRYTSYESDKMEIDLFVQILDGLGSIDDGSREFYGSDYENMDSDDYSSYESEDDYDNYTDDELYYESEGEYKPNFLANSRSMKEMLHQYVIMMKTANLEVKSEIKKRNGTIRKYSDFKTKCEDEIKKLKSEKVCANTNVTFYDIISKPIHNIVFYTRNPKILENIKKGEFKTKFPIYCGLINGKIVRAVKRRDILDRGYAFFDLLSDSLRLPYNCIENICSYLCDKELRILAEASKFKH